MGLRTGPTFKSFGVAIKCELVRLESNCIHVFRFACCVVVVVVVVVVCSCKRRGRPIRVFIAVYFQ